MCRASAAASPQFLRQTSARASWVPWYWITGSSVSVVACLSITFYGMIAFPTRNNRWLTWDWRGRVARSQYWLLHCSGCMRSTEWPVMRCDARYSQIQCNEMFICIHWTMWPNANSLTVTILNLTSDAVCRVFINVHNRKDSDATDFSRAINRKLLYPGSLALVHTTRWSIGKDIPVWYWFWVQKVKDQGHTASACLCVQRRQTLLAAIH